MHKVQRKQPDSAPCQVSASQIAAEAARAEPAFL